MKFAHLAHLHLAGMTPTLLLVFMWLSGNQTGPQVIADDIVEFLVGQINSHALKQLHKHPEVGALMDIADQFF